MAYPRSFLGLLLTGFSVVAVPLKKKLAYLAWNTERIADKTGTAVFSASQAARASRSLVNRISSIERLAQQLAVVEDSALAADYARVHLGFRQIADELLGGRPRGGAAAVERRGGAAQAHPARNLQHRRRTHHSACPHALYLAP